MTNILFFTTKKRTPLHVATFRGQASTCQLLCALDGIDQNAVDNDGETACDRALQRSKVECVRALLELNVDASKTPVEADTNVEIVKLFEEHRKQSVKGNDIFCLFERNFNFNLLFSGN